MKIVCDNKRCPSVTATTPFFAASRYISNSETPAQIAGKHP